MLIPEEMKVATCSAAPASWVRLRDTAPQKKGITPEDSVNAKQIYNASESKNQILERRHQVEQKDADKAEKHHGKSATS